MKALTQHGSKKVRVETVPDPILEAPDGILLRNSATAICGSDLHLDRGKVPGMKEGDILGHEFMGTVEETGKDVTRVKKGDRVVIPFTISSGQIMAGNSRQQVFEALRTQSTLAEEKLATLVRDNLTLEARRKFNTAWVALIILLLLGIVGKLFMAALFIQENGTDMWPVLLIFPLINVVLTIGVIEYRGETFRFVSLLTILGILRSCGREASGGSFLWTCSLPVYWSRSAILSIPAWSLSRTR